MIKQLQGGIYKIASNLTGGVVFVEAESDASVIAYVYNHKKGEPITVTRVLLNGKTPKLAVYTSDLYKQLSKENSKRLNNNGLVRPITGGLYRISSNVAMVDCFVEASDPSEVITYVYSRFRGTPVTVNRMCLDGSKPKLAVYTSNVWAKLEKGTR